MYCLGYLKDTEDYELCRLLYDKLTQIHQRNIPYYMTSFSAIKAGGQDTDGEREILNKDS